MSSYTRGDARGLIFLLILCAFIRRNIRTVKHKKTACSHMHIFNARENIRSNIKAYADTSASVLTSQGWGLQGCNGEYQSL